MNLFYKYVIISMALISPALSFPQTVKIYDPEIQSIVDNVSGDTLWARLSQLVTLQRYSTNTSAIQSSNYLKNYFSSLGFDTVYFQTYNGSYIPNVIAVKYGELIPDSVIVVGAHYDVYQSMAPGADDNGSGTVAVMETGRVIMGYDYKKTVKLVCFSGEEQGLYGSDAYATNAANTGEKIIAAITMDMIAYLKPGDPINSDVYFNTASTALRNRYEVFTTSYVSGFPVSDAVYPTGAGSDVEPFWDNGFPAIFPCEGQFDWIPQYDHCSPYMHTSQDIIGTSANSQDQAIKITKSVVATVVSIAELMPQTGIEDNSNSFLSANIYPNPANDGVYIKYYLPAEDNLSITVSDIYGKNILLKYNNDASWGMNEIFIDTRNFSQGIYIINLKSSDDQVIKELIISH
jgi:aminopeptidase YwaD